MKKVILVYTVLMVGAVIPYSCVETSSTEVSSFQILDFQLSAGRLSMADFSEFSSEDDTLSSDEFSLRITISEVEYISANNFVWVPSAVYADPVPISSSSKIDLITITSDKDLISSTQTYKAGEDLTSLWSASKQFQLATDVLSFIENKEDWYEYEPLFLIFNAQLVQPLSQKFYVKLIMDDGVIFNLESNVVVVK